MLSSGTTIIDRLHPNPPRSPANTQRHKKSPKPPAFSMSEQIPICRSLLLGRLYLSRLSLRFQQLADWIDRQESLNSQIQLRSIRS
jgi:hypothetical protein